MSSDNAFCQREHTLKEAPNGGVCVSIYRPERDLIGRTYDYVIVSEDLLGKIKNAGVVEGFSVQTNTRRPHFGLSETKCATGAGNSEREKKIR